MEWDADEIRMLLEEEIDPDTSIDDTRAVLSQWIVYMRSQEYQEHDIGMMAKMRSLKVETLHKCQSFMYDPDFQIAPEFFRGDLNLEWFSGRYVFPIFTSGGLPCGLVGWDKFDLPKYLDSRNHGYKAKVTTMMGMEEMHNYLSSEAPVIFVEGPICMLVLRENGFNALSFLGSYLSPYMAQVVRRFGRRAVVIPDSDASGDKLAIQAGRRCPQARIVRVDSDKDVDDSRMANPQFFQNLRTRLTTPFVDNQLYKL